MTDTIRTLGAQDAISIIWRINANMSRPDDHHKSTVRGTRKINYDRRQPSVEVNNSIHGPLRSLVGNWGKAVDKKRFSAATQQALNMFDQQREDYKAILIRTKTLLTEVALAAQCDQEELDGNPYGDADGLYKQIKSLIPRLSTKRARSCKTRLGIQMQQAGNKDKEASGALYNALDALGGEPQLVLTKEAVSIPNVKAVMLEGNGYRNGGISTAEMLYLGELAAQSTEDTTKIPPCLSAAINEQIGTASTILSSFERGFEFNPRLHNDTTLTLAERALQTMRLNIAGVLGFEELAELKPRGTEMIEALGLNDPAVFAAYKARVENTPRPGHESRGGGCPFGHG